jgi:pimeloyl-ACP methyl ester carboxylesterase
MDRQAIAADGYRITYDVTGDGPDVVVLVCGLLMNRGRWHAVGYVDRLAGRYKVITMDPMGHGASDKPHDPGAYRRSAVVDHLVAVLDSEDVDQAHLWGYSRGGALAAAVGADQPARTRSLIVGGCPVRPLSSEQAEIDALAAVLAGGDWETYWSFFPVPIPAPVRQHMEQENDPRAIAAAMQAGSELQIHPDELPAATFAYFANGEVFADDLEADLTEAGIDHRVIDAAGHAECFLDADACLAVAAPFLERH